MAVTKRLIRTEKYKRLILKILAKKKIQFILKLLCVAVIVFLCTWIVLYSSLLVWHGHQIQNILRDWDGSWGSCISPPIQYYFRTVWDPKRVESCSDLVLKAARKGKEARERGLKILKGELPAPPLDGCSVAAGGKDGSFGQYSFNGSGPVPDEACKLVWITYSSECGSNLGRNADICDMLGIELIIVGLHEMWMGWGGRTRVIREAVQSLPADRIVYSSDADDVLLVPSNACSPTRIITAFSSIGAPLSVTAERYCYPDGEKWSQFPEPPGNSPFRYVNAGSYIGYAWALTDVMKEAYDGDCLDDQRQLTSVFLRNLSYVGKPDLVGKRRIVDKTFRGPRNAYTRLDSLNKVMLAMGGSERPEFDLSGFKASGAVRDTITNSTPCFLHQNGAKIETDKVYVALPHIIQDIGVDEILRRKGYKRNRASKE